MSDRLVRADNYIEDAWDAAFKPPAGDTDEEAYKWYDDSDNDPTGDNTSGDRFTRYEEYRGFKCKGTYTTLDPKKKDVFLCDKTGYNITAGGSVVSLVAKSGVVAHEISETEVNDTIRSETEPQKHRIVNFNGGLHVQRALILENEGLSGYGESLGSSPSTNKYTLVDMDKVTAKVILYKAVEINDTTIIYKGTSDNAPLSLWVAAGKVKIDNEVIQYGTGETAGTNFGTAKTPNEVDIPAAAAETTILVDSTPPTEGENFKYVAIGTEIVKVGVGHTGGTGHLTADIGAGIVPIPVNGYIDPPANGYVLAKIGDEWISYDGYDDINNTLTGVKRGLFGSNAVAHSSGATIRYPIQYMCCMRAQLGTQLAILQKNAPVLPVGVLENCAVATAKHLANADMNVFSNPDEVIRHLAAHEIGHSIGMNHHTKIMTEGGNPNVSITRGCYLGLRLYDDYDALSKAEVNCK